MYPPNFKFAALLVPEIIGGTQKIWEVPGYAHAPLSPKFFMGFCADGPCECTGQTCSPTVSNFPVWCCLKPHVTIGSRLTTKGYYEHYESRSRQIPRVYM